MSTSRMDPDTVASVRYPDGDHKCPMVDLRSISKSFGRRLVLDNVSLSIASGEISSIVGLNGSGKSTLVKILAGTQIADGGEFILDGRSMLPAAPRELLAGGVRVVHQDLALVGPLSVQENLLLGVRAAKRGIIASGDERKEALEMLARLECRVPLEKMVGDCSPVEQTFIAISKALYSEGERSKLLILDEPTATLSSRESERLFDVVRKVAETGAAVLFIGHRLAEIEKLAERVFVLRAGRIVKEFPGRGLPHGRVVEAMIGMSVAAEPVQAKDLLPPPARGGGVLALRDAAIGGTTGIDIELCAGEIVGFAGVDGSGRERVARVISGVEAPRQGTVELHGRRVASSRDARRRGLVLVPNYRLQGSGVAEFSVVENVALTGPTRRAQPLIRRGRREMAAAGEWTQRLRVSPPDLGGPYDVLSGGNKQKVMLARGMLADPEVLVLDEPTAGVDPSTRETIYETLRLLAARGSAVVISSADLLDFEICDRVLVFSSDQRIVEIDVRSCMVDGLPLDATVLLAMG